MHFGLIVRVHGRFVHLKVHGYHVCSDCVSMHAYLSDSFLQTLSAPDSFGPHIRHMTSRSFVCPRSHTVSIHKPSTCTNIPCHAHLLLDPINKPASRCSTLYAHFLNQLLFFQRLTFFWFLVHRSHLHVTNI